MHPAAGQAIHRTSSLDVKLYPWEQAARESSAQAKFAKPAMMYGTTRPIGTPHRRRKESSGKGSGDKRMHNSARVQ